MMLYRTLVLGMVGSGTLAYCDDGAATVRKEAGDAASAAKRSERLLKAELTRELNVLKEQNIMAQLEVLKEEQTQLLHELRQRAIWEGITKQEAVMAKQLQVQELARAEEDKGLKKLDEEARRLSTEALLEVEANRPARVKESTATAVAAKAEELERQIEDTSKEREAAENELFKERELRFARALSERRLHDFEVGDEPVNQLREQVSVNQSKVDSASALYSRKREAHRLCSAAFELRDRSTTALALQVRETALSADAPITASFAAEAASAIEKSGEVPSEAELRARFVKVSREARRAAMVPEGLSYSAIAYLLASVLDTLKFSVVGGADPSPQEKAIALAEQNLLNSDLAAALDHLSSLQGLTAAVCSDWCAAAAARVLVDSTVLAALTEATSILA